VSLQGAKAASVADPLAAIKVNRTHPLSWGGAFFNGQACALCHSNDRDAQGMRGPDGAGVAPFEQWRATMMANAARDPLWRAVVSSEIAATPSLASQIEAKCLRCHAPMASTNAALGFGEAPTVALLGQRTVEAQLALDGVSCALCHQIQADNLGEAQSYSGRFTIGKERVIYGPYPDPYAEPMQHNANYTVAQGAHISRAALCGTCHTLFTDAVDAAGQPTGHSFAEQTPYLEWRNSDFSDEGPSPSPLARPCQTCHMPTLRGPDGIPWPTRVARTPHGDDFGPAPKRAPYSQHLLVGGNTLIPAMLRDNPDTFHPVAPPAAFDAIIELARDQLQQRTATLTWASVSADTGGEGEGARITARLQLKNLTGHRFPTGHPTRRAWLRVIATDATGRVVFSSGTFNARGQLTDGQGQPLPSEAAGGPTYPHLPLITLAGQPHVLELVMGTPDGAPTYSLMRAAVALKDNRLLPRGWRADHPDAAATSPHGVGDDPDFVGGADVANYQWSLPLDAALPIRIDASLHYQVLGARYAAELLTFDTPEVNAFRALYEAADVTPITVGVAVTLWPPHDTAKSP
jgi:hypothetical protein